MKTQEEILAQIESVERATKMLEAMPKSSIVIGTIFHGDGYLHALQWVLDMDVSDSDISELLRNPDE